jgi:hypothetical protein
VAILCRIDSVDQLRFAGLPRCGGCVLGVASRDWACARRDRSGGRAFALRAMGIGLLRSDARYGPAPLPPVCGRGVGGFFAGDRGLGLLGGFLGWLRGTGPALAGIVREVGLSRCARWGLGCCDPMLATAQSRCRRCVVGVSVREGAGELGLFSNLGMPSVRNLSPQSGQARPFGTRLRNPNGRR